MQTNLYMVVIKSQDELITYSINDVYVYTSVILNISLRYFVTQDHPIGYKHSWHLTIITVNFRSPYPSLKAWQL